MLPDVDGPLEEIELFNGTKLLLFGTAHVSAKSADDVAMLIETIKPDKIAIELCSQRFETITKPEQWKNTDIFTLIKSGKSSVLLLQLILASYQKRIANKLKIKPGAEMHKAIECASTNNIPLILIDRDIKVTLRRAWSNISFFDILKILFSSIFSSSKDEDITEEEIEALKNEDELSSALKEFSDKLPKLKKALVDERDVYMSSVLKESEGGTILAIVGAGHVPGMTELLKNSGMHAIDRTGISSIPPQSLFTKFLIYGIPAILIFLTLYVFMVFDYRTGLSMLGTWAFATGIGAAIGASCAFAHPLSILTAGIVAPLKPIRPGIATGWFSGLVEAWLRKPTVSDFESISEDLSSLKGMWSNRVMRTLLVVVLSNLGGMIGLLVGSLQLAGKLL